MTKHPDNEQILEQRKLVKSQPTVEEITRVLKKVLSSEMPTAILTESGHHEKQRGNVIENIEIMWLINELKPDFKPIANFRKDNKKAIKAAFRRFTMKCDELGLISEE